MNTRSILVLSIFFAIPLFADNQVQKALTHAAIGERIAAARYDAFAARADADGYLGAAALFRACAKAEHIHATRFEKLLHDRGLPVPMNELPKFDVRTTQENLETAVSSEQAERDSSYLYAINVANEANDRDAASLFDVTRDTETEHANLEAEALRHLDRMRAPREYYVCDHCGYTTEVHLSLCPSCRNHDSPPAVH
jgi:rubrerythrin